MKENKRVWDVKFGCVDYVEPKRETNFTHSQNHNIGSLSIKPSKNVHKKAVATSVTEKTKVRQVT